MRRVQVLVGILVVFATARLVGAQGMVTAHVETVAESAAMMAGENKAFSAAGVITIENKKKETATIKFGFAGLDGDWRTEVDAARIEGAAIPASEIEQMKAMNKEKIVTVTRPVRNKKYLVYPDMRAFLIQPIAGENEKAASAPKLEKTELGKETVDGHACVKSKVVVTPERGQRREFVVWCATDLKDFPIQIQCSPSSGFQVTAKFTDIKFDKPEEALFRPPRGYMKCDSPSDLMGAAMRGKR